MRRLIPNARAFLFFLLAFAAVLASAAPGDVIRKVLTPFAGGTSKGFRPVLQADGKILIAGSASFGTGQFAVTRLNPDGSVDPSYGAGAGYGAGNAGTQIVTYGPGFVDASAAMLQADGKLVIAGELRDDNHQARPRFAVARLNTDGSLDATFQSRAFAVGSGDSGAFALAIQGDGKILLGGYSTTGSRDVFTVVRLNGDGSLDTTYGIAGTYYDVEEPLSDAFVRSMVLQPDGNLVIAGVHTPNELKTQRLTPAGTRDTSWGTSGSSVLPAFFRGGFGIAIQPDGKVLVTGSAMRSGSGSYAFAVVRLTTAGAADPTFGSGDGIARSPFATGEGYGVLVQPDGKIVVSGAADGTSTSEGHWMFRFLPNGSPDPAFSGDGEAFIGISPYSVFTGGVVRRGDGSLVTAGSRPSGDGVSFDTSVVSFTANGDPDTSFGGSGMVTLDLGSKSARATASAVQADGKLVVGGILTTSGDFGAGSILARYLPGGALDTSFGTNGYTFFNAANTDAVVLQPDGKIVVGGMKSVGGDPSIMFARFNGDGTLDPTFGSGGIASFPTAAAREWVKAVAIQPDGRIVGAGLIKSGSLTDGRLVRITANGALDTSFGSGGYATVNMSSLSDELYALALQPDGRIVVAGRGEVSATQSVMTAARLDANGVLDASFGTGGKVTLAFPGGESWAYAVAVQGDGRIVLGGYAHPGTNNDFALARLLADGTLDPSFGSGGLVTTDFGSDQNGVRALKVLSSGKIVAAGWDVGGTFGVVQYLANGALDTAFGSGGHTAIPMNSGAGADVAYTISVASDGTLYAAGDASNMFGLAILAGDAGTAPPRATATMGIASSANPSTAGQSVTFTVAVSGSSGMPTGTVTFNDNGSPVGGCGALSLASGSAQCATSALSNGSHAITVAYSGDSAYEPGTSSAFTQTVSAAPGPGALALNPASIDFGTESMGTTSPPRTVTVTNTGGSTVTISGIMVTSQFGQSNDCGALAPGATCSIAVTFSPAPAQGELNSSGAVSGTLTVSSDAGNPSAALQGRGEKSLVTHYYRGILRRDPDASGRAFWQGEAQRLASLGANVNETWFAMAMEFLRSAEYASFGRDDAGYVTDMYNTFFNRAPDASGFDYWMGQMRSGMPRETVLAQFVFSGEFASFTRAIFGDTSARPEVDLTMDFYRGALSRLPDAGGFNFYLGRLRSAQCSGAAAVASLAETISAEFFNGAEYLGRNRSNAQYMADIYNALMRRGSDLEGMNFWIGKLDRGEATRDQVRQQFLQSSEFTRRVDNIAGAGCAQ